MTTNNTTSDSTIRTYAAKEASGSLERYDYDTGGLKNNEVEIKISHYGICHSDLSIIDNEWDMSDFPVVAGHEAVGRYLQSIRSRTKSWLGLDR